MVLVKFITYMAPRASIADNVERNTVNNDPNRITIYYTKHLFRAVHGLEFKAFEFNKCAAGKESFVTHFVGESISDCVDQCARRPSCKLAEHSVKLQLCNLYSMNNITLTNGHCDVIKRTDISNESLCVSNCDDGHGCGNSNNCLKFECDPFELPNLKYYGNVYTIGSRRKYVCEYENLEVKITNHVTCLTNGSWDHIPTCVQLLNVAFGKEVTMNSNYQNGTAPEKLVDGDKTGLWPEMACTRRDYMPWMIVNLVDTYTIYEFHVYNRIDCCPERLHALRITVGETLDALEFCVQYKLELDPVVHIFPLRRPCVGRYIKLQIMDVEYLTITELEAFGASSDDMDNY